MVSPPQRSASSSPNTRAWTFTRSIPETAWLGVPQQRLRTIASGEVFHDGLQQLTSVRSALEWYPHDIWLYLLACQWQRLDQEEPFVGRCGDMGDELGSKILAARVIRDLMRLCFLMERQYAPYSKWLGTAFSKLHCASTLAPIFSATLRAEEWKNRQRHLSEAYEFVAAMHNALRLTELIAANVSPYHNRPYLVIHSSRFVDALYARIESPAVRALPGKVGSVDQIADSTDVLDSIERCRRLIESIGVK